MPDQIDFDLRTNEAAGGPVEPESAIRRRGPIVAIALLLVAAAIAVYVVFFRQPSAPVEQQTAAPAPPATAAPATPLGGEAEPVDVPPLDESDPVVRTLVSKLSSHPRVAAWLTTSGLIRNFTVVVSNIADGTTPARHLQTLRPSGAFEIVERDDELVVNPRSYERYDRLAEAVTSIEAAGSARLYATLKPRIEEAYRDLGYPDGSFDRALERAIASLLAAPVVEGSVEVVPKGIVYGYADPELEALTAAQKQLLRMGPRNMRAVQAKLREIALALGIPAERLPPAR